MMEAYEYGKLENANGTELADGKYYRMSLARKKLANSL